MAALNQVTLVGNLISDPEIQFFERGTALAKFSIAIDRRYTDQAGQRCKETCYVPVVAWGRQAEMICKYMKKGSPILISGRLQTYKWKSAEGESRSQLRVCAETFQFIGK